MASDMDAIRARLRVGYLADALEARIGRLLDFPGDAQDVHAIRALLAENEQLEKRDESIARLTGLDGGPIIDAQAVEIARLTAEVERWKKSSEIFEWGARLQEENYHDALKGWRAEVETLQAALAKLTELKHVVDEQLIWALGRIDEVKAALAAANERAEKAEVWMRLLIAQCRDRGRIYFTADGETTITEAADAALRLASPPEAPRDRDCACDPGDCEGHCTVCGLAFEPNISTHECPPGFTKPEAKPLPLGHKYVRSMGPAAHHTLCQVCGQPESAHRPPEGCSECGQLGHSNCGRTDDLD